MTFTDTLTTFITLSCVFSPILPSPCRPTTNETLKLSPGEGWDSLVSLTKSRAVPISFSSCQTTPDGRYQIPDQVRATVVKKSRVQLYSKLFDKWSDFVPATASSFNKLRGKNLYGAPSSVEGSYSDEFLSVKVGQVRDGCKLLRVQLKVVEYTLNLRDEFLLDKDLQSGLLEVSEHLEGGDKLKARYLAEKLVSSYGTHVIDKVDVGGMIVEENCVNVSFVEENRRNDVTGAASIEFLSMINFRNRDIAEGISHDFLMQYKKSRVYSTVKTYGGDPIHANISIEKWITDVGDNLVIVDRQGDFLHNFITPEVFSNVDVAKVLNLRQLISDIVDKYYAYNKHQGCTDASSKQFDFTANVDDGSCGKTGLTYPFSGFFQKCRTNVTSNHTNPCKGLNQTNPLTNDYTCPATSIPIILLDYADTTRPVLKPTKKHTVETVELQTTWCASEPSHIQKLLFGGSYSKSVTNPLTGSFSCPHEYFKTRLSYDVIVCLSVISDVSSNTALPFGGFFSCVNGNPQSPISQPEPYHVFLHECSAGYGEHVITFTNDCYIKQCVNLSSFRDEVSLPLVGPSVTDTVTVFSRQGGGEPPTPAPDSGGLGTGDIVAIVLGCVLLIVAIVGILSVMKKRRHSSNNQTENPSSESSSTPYQRLPSPGPEGPNDKEASETM